MKKLILVFVVLMANLLSLPAFSQIENEPVALGLPGDNLNLYAVLEVFQKSPTLEAFEKALNDSGTNINNLDLNNDNLTDYIQVVSYKEGNSHSIVLRVAINNNEYQDVAVIEVNKNNIGNISVQIIGDEELYGRDYIVEPSGIGTPNPAYAGDRTVIINGSGGFYINDWPIMAYLFSPAFSIYISPWHWGYYPSYWYPWAPINYYNYWGFHNHYYRNNFYRRSGYLRDPGHYSYYTRRRSSSPFVIQNRRSGNYNRTYEGRNYRRQTMPSTRQIIPSRRQTMPSTRQTLPSRRQTMPSTRQTMPSTRQTMPSTRQTLPSRRQTMPSTRPMPSTRQTMPSRRQTTHPPMPSSRPDRQATPERRGRD